MFPWLKFLFSDPSQKLSTTLQPLFFDIFTNFGVKYCFRTFSKNQLGSAKFCSYEPILMKSAEVILLNSG